MESQIKKPLLAAIFAVVIILIAGIVFGTVLWVGSIVINALNGITTHQWKWLGLIAAILTFISALNGIGQNIRKGHEAIAEQMKLDRVSRITNGK